VQQFRTHGISRAPADQARHGGWFYAMQELGFNYRLNDVQSALGWSQLRKLAAFIARRREIARTYDAALGGLGLALPVVRAGVEPAWHLYVVRVGAGERRALFEALQAAGLGVQVHYLPVYWHPYYRELGFRRGLCPVAEAFYAGAVSLPIFPRMTDDEVGQVIERVTRIRRGAAGTGRVAA
jgi:dTDP-4-amino-4,6-dideoxygalactose transaminase